MNTATNPKSRSSDRQPVGYEGWINMPPQLRGQPSEGHTSAQTILGTLQVPTVRHNAPPSLRNIKAPRIAVVKPQEVSCSASWGHCMGHPDCTDTSCEGHPDNAPSEVDFALRARFWQCYIFLVFLALVCASVVVLSI